MLEKKELLDVLVEAEEKRFKPVIPVFYCIRVELLTDLSVTDIWPLVEAIGHGYTRKHAPAASYTCLGRFLRSDQEPSTDTRLLENTQPSQDHRAVLISIR
ncbi:hypothetical protein AV530_002329 [Patagioenas fasciata monilis]|uniref:Uncharacterized protein n=1 Tax=Patagioenas fasciata monilis TaxID=372326 RepID=A0A1V4K672_PATFA|nr:hypothetical protein AV530_002329 [Patagioenas fasciata monilis]